MYQALSTYLCSKSWQSRILHGYKVRDISWFSSVHLALLHFFWHEFHKSFSIDRTLSYFIIMPRKHLQWKERKSPSWQYYHYHSNLCFVIIEIPSQWHKTRKIYWIGQRSELNVYYAIKPLQDPGAPRTHYISTFLPWRNNYILIANSFEVMWSIPLHFSPYIIVTISLPWNLWPTCERFIVHTKSNQSKPRKINNMRLE